MSTTFKGYVCSSFNTRALDTDPRDDGFIALAEAILDGIYRRMGNVLLQPTENNVREITEDLNSEFVSALTMGHNKEVLKHFEEELVKIGYWPASAI